MNPSLWPAWVVAVPLAGAVLTLVGGPRLRAGAAFAAAAGTLAAAAALTVDVATDGPVRHALGGWGAPLGIELYADGLSTLMVAVTAVIAAAAGVHARGYFQAGADGDGDRERDRDGDGDGRYYWPLWLFLWAGLNALFLSADIFNQYVSLELVALAAVAMVALRGDSASAVAGTRYLLISLLGSGFFLLGVALLYGMHGTLALEGLAAAIRPGPAAWLALGSMSMGLFLKTALFPLHAWLPPAHAAAPAPASALLSGLVVKGSFYLLLRLWFEVFPVPADSAALGVVGMLGAGAVFWGSALALRQSGLKLLVAYSTVGQIGYLFLLFPLVGSPPPGGLVGEAAGWHLSAWQGGIYHALSHALAKAAMFLAAASMVRAVGGDRIAGLAGISTRRPLAFAAFGLAGLSLVGLPPTGGFIAKWLLLVTAVEHGRWAWAAVILIGSFMAAGYVFLVLRYAFQRPREARAAPAPRPGQEGAAPAARIGQEPTAPVPLTMELPALVLAFLAVLMGIFATRPLALLELGRFPPIP